MNIALRTLLTVITLCIAACAANPGDEETDTGQAQTDTDQPAVASPQETCIAGWPEASHDILVLQVASTWGGYSVYVTDGSDRLTGERDSTVPAGGGRVTLRPTPSIPDQERWAQATLNFERSGEVHTYDLSSFPRCPSGT